MRLAERLENALKAGRLAIEQAETCTKPERVGLLALIGLDDASFRQDQLHIPMSKNKQLILITNSTDIELFQIENIVTEFIPYEKHCDDRKALYCAYKFSQICKKWDLQKLQKIDIVSKEVLASWHRICPDVAHWPVLP